MTLTQSIFKKRGNNINSLNTTTKTIIHISNNKHKKCKWCGKQYKPHHNWEYCSKKCQQYADTPTTTLYIDHKSNTIVGIAYKQKIIKRWYKNRQCKWCGNTYTPTSPPQKYCNQTCNKYAQQENTMNRVRKYRQKYKQVLKEIITNTKIGTGNLGGHACTDWQEEQNKIRKEMRELGIINPFHY